MFTVPAAIGAVAFQNKAVVYAILFEAALWTLKTIAADRRHLGGEIGGIAILHSWGQALTHHPHIHCLIPGGALAQDGRWIACRPNFFLPIHVLSRLFRRRFIERLVQAHDAGELSFFGDLLALNEPEAFAGMMAEQRRINWIVYAKPPFGAPQHVLAYLGRYTHRVAIANSRLVSLDDDAVAFRWRDYRHGNAARVMTLHPAEFIRRFLLHALPDGFHRIRHFGFLANGHRRSRLVLIRQAIAASASMPMNNHDADVPGAARPARLAFDPALCPCCGGAMRVIATFPRCRPCPDTS